MLEYSFSTLSDISDFIVSEGQNTLCNFSKGILTADLYIDNPIIFVAKEDGKIVGFAITPKDRSNYLSALYVKDKYRKQGIAKCLVNMLNINRLSCIPQNEGALSFYEVLGFNTVCVGEYMNILERKI